MKYVALVKWDTEGENGDEVGFEMFEVEGMNNRAAAKEAALDAAVAHLKKLWGWAGGIERSDMTVVKILGPYTFAGSVEFGPARPITPPSCLHTPLIEHLIREAVQVGYDRFTMDIDEQVWNCLPYIEEKLKPSEVDEVFGFLFWAFTDWKNRCFGSANYNDRVNQYLADKEK